MYEPVEVIHIQSQQHFKALLPLLWLSNSLSLLFCNVFSTLGRHEQLTKMTCPCFTSGNSLIWQVGTLAWSAPSGSDQWCLFSLSSLALWNLTSRRVVSWDWFSGLQQNCVMSLATETYHLFMVGNWDQQQLLPLFGDQWDYLISDSQGGITRPTLQFSQNNRCILGAELFMHAEHLHSNYIFYKFYIENNLLIIEVP